LTGLGSVLVSLALFAMPDCETTSKSRFPSLCLDYGADEQVCDSSFSLSERGMRFVSRWQFSLGTQLSVACVWPEARLGKKRMMLEGIVVWCEPTSTRAVRSFETTVLFLELPEELKRSLRDVSFEVGAE